MQESLPTTGSLAHKSFPNGHFVLPDTNVFLAQVRDIPTFKPLRSHIYLDGLDGIESFHSADHSVADGPRGSSPSFAPIVQPLENPRQVGREADLGLLQ